ncbi:GNAT family N-acetyltransferase [Galbibacter mesophilus]|uniref:GNAT family N-acetyltransferase n=1 Tax=Galbibacter mesophilus TaxID=379069 RepID=UPI00191F5B8C|nr:GNAT family N-acetyltransferase [Galbibacter mesophilus]MCM5662342.1 GNAT family N-acetyltransferase [Galbibacter mesophilus]
MKSMEELNFFTISGKLSNDEIAFIEKVYVQIFEDYQRDSFLKRISEAKNLFSVYASLNNEVVGFKIGYETSPDTFYSWVGGVKEEYRRMGIAKKLQSIQEKYVAEKGCQKLTTKSTNKFKPMMQFNLKNGFDIVGAEPSKNGLKILFEKRLDH